MNRSKLLSKLIVLATVGTLIFGFIPAIIASEGKGSATIRPIEDWLIPNNYDNMPPAGGHMDFDTGLIIWTQLLDPSTESYKPIMESTYNGYILQRELKENKILVTINLHMEDAPFFICIYPFEPVFKGTMKYTYHFKIIIDLDLYPEDLFDEDGNVIFAPWYHYVWYPEMMGCEFVSVHFNGAGEGEFVVPWESWEAEDTAKMKVNSVLLVKENFNEDHPNYNLYGLNELLPASFISFH